MAVSELKCELSWSASRAKEFERCRREYWYARYASWGWWTERPRGQKYEVMVHKNLTSLPAFAGDVMHRAIERWFELKRHGSEMTESELFEEAVALFREGWRESHGGGWQKKPNKMMHLEEHHYELPLSPEQTDNARQVLERCAKNFCTLPELEPVRKSHPDDWRSVESLDTYHFLGTKVYAVPDFAHDHEGRLHIWDWKTGRPREADQFQLLTYALYACEKWATDPETITLHAAYLATGEIQTTTAEIEALSAAQDRMSESVREMMDVHYDPDVDDLQMENWGTTGAPDGCRRCRFRGICDGAPKD